MVDNLAHSGVTWSRLRPEAIEALRNFLHLLENSDSMQDLVDSYQYARGKSAETMQARMRMHLSIPCDTFHQLRDKLHAEAAKRYGGAIPSKYLRIPYGSRTHEELFSLLLDRQGTPVPASLLRVLTADSTHTERRTRELRELGLDIEASRTSGADMYTLQSLKIDDSKLVSIVRNNVEKDKEKLPSEERQRYLQNLEG